VYHTTVVVLGAEESSMFGREYLIVCASDADVVCELTIFECGGKPRCRPGARKGVQLYSRQLDLPAAVVDSTQVRQLYMR
jgi:hypothetical protein